MQTVEKPNPLILIIEDDEMLRQFLFVTLSSQGYRVVEAPVGKQGLALAEANQPDLVLLDLGLPDIDGLEVTEQLREWTLAPIIVISAKFEEKDKVAALDAGADDYITKPLSVGELLARVRVGLRHADQIGHSGREPYFESGNLKIDYVTRKVSVNGKEVHLTPIEYRLLVMLAKRAGQVATHRQILVDVWGQEYAREKHYLRVYMKRLRDKIEADPAQPLFLESQAGVGYLLKKI